MSESKKFNSVTAVTDIGSGDTLLLTDSSGAVRRVTLSTLLSQINQGGGRNLILDSSKQRSGLYGLTGLTLSKPLQKGKTYTVSAYGFKLGEGKTSVQAWNRGGIRGFGELKPTDGGKTYRLTFTVSEAHDEGRLDMIEIIVFPSSVKTLSSFDFIKLEEGSIPTVWTPAPEDLVTISGG
ncbi:MAG: hypothetical protein K2G69_04400 [Muribaculaceae bacterium]|nr:hypothetical protein [Muribaculaceae bacterium]